MNKRKILLNSKNAKLCIILALLYLVSVCFIFLVPQYDLQFFYMALWLTLINLILFPIYYWQDYLNQKIIKRNKKTLLEKLMNNREYQIFRYLILFFTGYAFAIILCLQTLSLNFVKQTDMLLTDMGKINLTTVQSNRNSKQKTQFTTTYEKTYTAYCSVYEGSCPSYLNDQIIKITFKEINKSSILIYTIQTNDSFIEFKDKYLKVLNTKNLFIVIFLIPSIIIFWLNIYLLPIALPLKRKIYL